MSEAVTTNSLGTTEMILRTVRASQATGIEVTSPESETAISLRMMARQVTIDVTGGPPGGEGPPGKDGTLTVVETPPQDYDPGDMTLIFENRLI